MWGGASWWACRPYFILGGCRRTASRPSNPSGALNVNACPATDSARSTSRPSDAVASPLPRSRLVNVLSDHARTRPSGTILVRLTTSDIETRVLRVGRRLTSRDRRFRESSIDRLEISSTIVDNLKVQRGESLSRERCMKGHAHPAQPTENNPTLSPRWKRDTSSRISASRASTRKHPPTGKRVGSTSRDSKARRYGVVYGHLHRLICKPTTHRSRKRGRWFSHQQL